MFIYFVKLELFHCERFNSIHFCAISEKEHIARFELVTIETDFVISLDFALLKRSFLYKNEQKHIRI